MIVNYQSHTPAVPQGLLVINSLEFRQRVGKAGASAPQTAAQQRWDIPQYSVPPPLGAGSNNHKWNITGSVARWHRWP
jgi:hypothetical protein